MKNVTMKIKTLVVVTFGATLGYSQVDLVPGMTSSYQEVDSNCEIQIDNIDVCNNGNDDASPFDVTMYFYEPNSQDVYFIATTRMDNGLSGNACITISDWDFIVSDNSIPAGTYRLGIWVDSDEEISESDEDNNTGLLTGDNDYEPCSGTSSLNEIDFIDEIKIFPNPVRESLNVSFELSSYSDIEMFVLDLTGKEVLTPVAFENHFGLIEHEFNTSLLSEGVYLLNIKSNNGVVSKKITVLN